MTKMEAANRLSRTKMSLRLDKPTLGPVDCR
jgi:hypothetical protein